MAAPLAPFRSMLQSSGVRRPWMPAPLRDGADRLARGVVIVAFAAALPGASVWQPWPIKDAPVAPEESTRPASIQVAPQPLPNPIALFLRGGRATDPDRLAPISIVASSPPLPSASVLALRGGRPGDPDRLAPVRSVVGQQPVPYSVTTLTPSGRPADPDRVFSPSIITSQPPIPGAVLRQIGSIRATPTDRLAPPLVTSGWQPSPQALVLWARSLKDAPVVLEDRVRPLSVLIGPQPTPQAAMVRTAGGRIGDPERALRSLLAQGWQPTPEVQSLRTLGGRTTDPARLARVLLIRADLPPTLWHVPLPLWGHSFDATPVVIPTGHPTARIAMTRASALIAAVPLPSALVAPEPAARASVLGIRPIATIASPDRPVADIEVL